MNDIRETLKKMKTKSSAYDKWETHFNVYFFKIYFVFSLLSFFFALLDFFMLYVCVPVPHAACLLLQTVINFHWWCSVAATRHSPYRIWHNGIFSSEKWNMTAWNEMKRCDANWDGGRLFTSTLMYTLCRLAICNNVELYTFCAHGAMMRITTNRK